MIYLITSITESGNSDTIHADGLAELIDNLKTVENDKGYIKIIVTTIQTN